MDPLVNTDEAPKGAMYGQSTCPNAPHPCLCNGACNKQPSFVKQHNLQKAVEDARPPSRLQRIDLEVKNPKSVHNGTFVTPAAAQRVDFEQPVATAPIASANPEDYYNGTGALDNMIAAYGKEAVRSWSVITAHKYIERMGLKEGNSLDQEKKKALWYIGTAERLYKELQAELA